MDQTPVGSSPVVLNTPNKWLETGRSGVLGMRAPCMPPRREARPLSRDLVRMIREISKKETQGLAEGLRVVEERQAREIEFYLQACALRLETSL